MKQRIRALVRRYLHHRSPRLAQQVARWSEGLTLRPAPRDAAEELNALCRLTWHWRLLAAQCPAAAAA
ncbi:hypothetical protein [uncultured Thiohalocapsa sp.]|uniref:hypothetical protein n=1 Tax=uncultured Thiohalocapsa sp. TaxID=768990 RepID=UPI0025F6B363|nr:hypothetical protein [uncultured Thiohalocapsa sp.]